METAAQEGTGPKQNASAEIPRVILPPRDHSQRRQPQQSRFYKGAGRQAPHRTYRAPFADPPQVLQFASPPSIVTIQVGDTLMVTTLIEILVSRSTWFAARLVGNAPPPLALPNNIFFVPADPELFPYIHSFLATGVCPLFWDATTGFDHAKYAALLGQARLLGIDGLAAWIQERRYVAAVSYRYTCQALTLDQMNGSEALIHTHETPSLKYKPHFHFKRVYLCPRRLLEHRGQRSLCAADNKCQEEKERVKGPGKWKDDFEDEPMVSVMATTCTPVVDYAVLETA